MKQRSSHISTRSRIVLVAILAIIVPTVVLSLFGLQLINERESFNEERLKQALRTASQLMANGIVQDVQSLENNLFEYLALDDTENLAERLKDAEERFPVAEQIFLLNSSEEYLYPVLERPAEPALRMALPFEEEVNARKFLKDGYYWEFEKKDPAKALEFYSDYKEQITAYVSANRDPDLNNPENRRKGAVEEARAIQLVASCLFKMGEYERCVQEYSYLADDPVFLDTVFDLCILAKHQVGLALYKLGRREEATAKLLDLYEVLLETKPRTGDGPLIEFFKRKVIGELNSFVAEGIAEKQKIRYELLKNEDVRLQQRREFLSKVKTWWQYRRSFMTDENPPADQPQHVERRELGMDPIYFLPVRLRPRDTTYSLIGFKVNLKYVAEKIAAESVKEAQFPPTANVSIVDENQRVMYGPPVDTDAQPEVMVAFPNPFNFWKVYVTEKDPLLARRTARTLTVVYTSLILVIVCVIIGGVYLTIKDMNRELELTKMKSDFVSNVSHELKTPLALIRMFSETLLMGRVKNDERRMEYYDVITRESERLTALINNVLDFSKIDAGRRTYDMKRASLGEVIKNTLGAYRYELSKENFDVQVDIDPDLPEILMDEDAIVQALLNLLNNAVKYSREKKEIRVSARRKGEMIHVSVQDSGIGISREDQKKIFDMFYRGSEESVRTTRGTGLGLAITKHTAEAHGGTVLVSSVKDEGSCFTIILPVRQESEQDEIE